MYYNSEKICTTIVKGKEETMGDKALQRKLTIKEHRSHKNQGINAGVPEG